MRFELFLLVCVGVFSFVHGDVLTVLPTLPTARQSCEYDAFVTSGSYNGKVFLYPWETSDRQGDWLKARGFCAANCAEMVTIHSELENDFFMSFMNTLGITNFVWLGALINSKIFSGWENGELDSFNNHAPAQYDQNGLTCLNAHINADNYWYNYFWLYANYYIACQRPANWTTC